MDQKHGILLWICIAGLLGQLVEFSYSAVLPIIAIKWSLSGFEAGFIFSIFRGGYLLAILFIGGLMDFIGARKVMIACSLLVGVAGSAFALFAGGFLSGLLFRGIAGIGGAGVYIPGIKLLSEWFPESDRGRAIGLYVGFYIFGSAISIASAGWITSISNWRIALLILSAGSFIAAGIIYFLVEGKSRLPRSERFRVLDIKLIRNKPLMLAIIGYTGHNWELFGMWGWLAPFLIASIATLGWEGADSIGATLAAILIALGGLASFLGGYISDRMGRIKTTTAMLIISGICSLIFGWLIGMSLPLIVMIGLIYGFFIVGDSPIFSTQVTEFAPKEKVGAALGLQSFIGFIPTIISPVVFGAILDATGKSWGWAFATLAFGAFIGLLSTLLLRQNLMKDQPMIRK